MKILQAHPSLAPFVIQSSIAYHEKKILEKFCTSFHYRSDTILDKLLKKTSPGIVREFERRSFNGIPSTFIETYPYRELLRIFASRYSNHNLADKIWEWAETSFDKWVSRQITQNTSVVHIYEHAALSTLLEAKERGIFTIYEQPSQHHKFFHKILLSQIDKYPELDHPRVKLLFDKKSEKRNDRRDQELQLADLVICNSSFTKKSLIAGGINPGKIKVIPYGFPKILSARKSGNEKSKIVFLNAGTQNLRKGIHILYNAWRKCNFNSEEAELLLIGKNDLPQSLRENLPGEVVFKQSIPRDELMEIYNQVDVFVIPTLADGFGMVITEAMASGVPVITTENSCGGDFITSYENGILVSPDSEEELANALKWCMDNRKELNKLGENARETALKWQWSDYQKKLIEIVEETKL